MTRPVLYHAILTRCSKKAPRLIFSPYENLARYRRHRRGHCHHSLAIDNSGDVIMSPLPTAAW